MSEEEVNIIIDEYDKVIKELKQENKQLKDALQDIKEYIESNLINHCNNDFLNDIKDIVNIALGDKE